MHHGDLFVLNKIAVLPRGDPDNALEAPGEVALIGKAGFKGDPGKGVGPGQTGHGAMDPNLSVIGVGGEAGLAGEYADKMKGAEVGDPG